MLHFRQAFGMVVGVGGHFRHLRFPACRVRMAHHGGFPGEGVDGGCHVVPAQQVALHGLRQAALHVVAVHQTDVTVTPLGLHPCAREVSRRVSLLREGGQVGEALKGSEGIRVVVVCPLHFGTAQRQCTGIARFAHTVAAPAEGSRHYGLFQAGKSRIRALPLYAQPSELVVEVEGIASGGLLEARLREDHPVAPVSVVSGEFFSGTS